MSEVSEVKPGVGVLLNYFSIYLNNLSFITSISDEISTICNDEQTSMAVFCTFGSSDVLVLGISDTCEKLNEMQQMQSYKNVKGIMDIFSYYGTAISVFPEPFNLDEETKSNPIIGTISIKIRMNAWGEICNNLKNFDELKVKLEEEFKKAIRKTSKDCKGLDSTNFKAILVLSYGVEDGIIILLTQSFQYIKSFVANIRTLELLDIIDPKQTNVNFKHIIVDTFTTLGIKLNNNFEPPKLIENTYDKLSWNMFLKIRPGHLQYAINEVSELISVHSKPIKAIPIIGRNDLIMQSASDGEGLSDFLGIHTNIVDGVKNNKAIQSIETHLNFPELKNLESPSYNETLIDEDQPLNAALLDLYNSINGNENLTTLERSSFTQIIRKLEFLLNDRYLQDSFITLLPIVKIGILEYMSLKFKDKVDPRNKSIDFFTILIECCYTTRYRGNPPFGETAVSPTLGYYSIGSKVLALLDFISNRILKVIYENYANKNRDIFFPRYTVTSNVTSTIALTFNPLPLPLSFILLPPQSLTQPLAIVITFLHELGHIVLNSFLCSDKMIELIETNNVGKDQMFILRNEFSEVFAEFFAAKVLTDLNFDKYKNITNSMLDQLFKNTAGTESSRIAKLSEIAIAESLNKYIKRDPECLGVRIQDLIKISLPIANEMSPFLIFIAQMDDAVIDEIRKFFQSENKREGFWDLWIFINRIRGDCYAEI